MKSSAKIKGYLSALALASTIVACATPAMRQAEMDASSRPSVCESSLANGPVAFEGMGIPTEEWRYRFWLFHVCVSKAINKDPRICEDVLAAGPPSRAYASTNEGHQASIDYSRCRSLASERLKSRYISSSKLKLGADVYNDEIDAENTSFGRIASVQIENYSRSSTTGAAHFGSGIGQIAYLENTAGLTEYNPWSQLSAGLAGAVVGSALDDPGKVLFKKTYWVKLNSGEFLSVNQYDNTQGHLPEGMCVAILNDDRMQQAGEKHCPRKR